MGGKSNTSTNANQTTSETNTSNTTNQQTDNSKNVDLNDVEFGVAAGGDLSFQQVNNSTDFGAVKAGIDAAQHGTDAALDFGSEALDFGSHTVDAGFSFGTKALDAVTKSSADTSSKLSSAIDQVAAASRTDAANSFDKVTKFATVGVIVVVLGVAAIFIFKK